MTRVNYGIATRLFMICFDKILNPGHHVCRVLVVAVNSTLEVNHTRKSYAVRSPAPPVRKKECCLAAAGTHVRAGKMVSAANQLRIGGADVVA